MKAVLYDFNGTLYSDTHIHHEAWCNFIWNRLGLKMTKEEVFKTCIGPSNLDIFNDLFDGKLSPEEIKAYSYDKEVEYRAAARSNPDNLHMRPGADEMMDWLTEHNIPFAVATVSPVENVQFYLDDLGLGRWFNLEDIIYDEGKLATKPDPAFYLEAARRLGVDIADCIIVEDSPVGIEAAKRAKCGRIIAVAGSSNAEALKADPDIYAVIEDFRGFERFVI